MKIELFLRKMVLHLFWFWSYQTGCDIKDPDVSQM